MIQSDQSASDAVTHPTGGLVHSGSHQLGPVPNHAGTDAGHQQRVEYSGAAATHVVAKPVVS